MRANKKHAGAYCRVGHLSPDAFAYGKSGLAVCKSVLCLCSGALATAQKAGLTRVEVVN